MILITWNVQWCRGMDGNVDPARVARIARELANFDVLCLQEVAINFPGLPGSAGEDQVAELAAALPGYTGIYGAATDTDDGSGRRSMFGNAIFTRLPIVQVYRHLLPWPADPTVLSMQRMALEAVLFSPGGPLRLVTTHLEYYSGLQRMAQVEALRRLHAEACGHARAPRVSGKPGEPFQAFVRIGLVPDSGSTRTLVRALGRHRAAALIFGGEPLPAAEARAAGLVNEVLPAEELAAAAHAAAAKLAGAPTRAIAFAKRAINHAEDALLSESLAMEASLQELAGRTEDHAEGAAAFAEKREPRFVGR